MVGLILIFDMGFYNLYKVGLCFVVLILLLSLFLAFSLLIITILSYHFSHQSYHHSLRI
jgi:hypothetical protein